jgi:hypothetical protein
MSDSIDPYRSPESNTVAVALPAEVVPAGKGRRFGTFIVDYIGFFILSFVIGFVIGIVGGGETLQTMGKGGEYLFGMFVMVTYYSFFEGL